MTKDSIETPFSIYQPSMQGQLCTPSVCLTIKIKDDEWWYISYGCFQAARLEGELYLRTNSWTSYNTRLQRFLGCDGINQLREKINTGEIHVVDFSDHDKDNIINRYPTFND